MLFLRKLRRRIDISYHIKNVKCDELFQNLKGFNLKLGLVDIFPDVAAIS